MLKKKTVSQCVSGDWCRGWNAAIDAMPKWISVEEREPDGECLAVGKYGDMLIGCVYLKGVEYWCENEHEILYNVTHWMPLPPAPKEG